MWLPNRFTCCGSYFNCWIIDVKFPSYHNIHTCSFSPFLHYKIYSGWKKNWYSTHWSQQSLSLAALQTPPPSIGVAVALSIYHHYLEHEDMGCSELCGDRGWPEHFIYQPDEACCCDWRFYRSDSKCMNSWAICIHQHPTAFLSSHCTLLLCLYKDQINFMYCHSYSLR